MCVKIMIFFFNEGGASLNDSLLACLSYYSSVDLEIATQICKQGLVSLL